MLKSRSQSGMHEYAAFISYRHADNIENDHQWATWLHHQLEEYDVPEDLIGTLNSRGERIPERIYPVFRDEVSLPTEADLPSAISETLDRSRYLIVLCSPRAVSSRYVCREIVHFKAAGKSNRVIAALLSGEPNASRDPDRPEDPSNQNTFECFPPPLMYQVDDSGEPLLDRPVEPLAADFRLPGGGWGITEPTVYRRQLIRAGTSRPEAENLSAQYEEKIASAKLKIIAGILGVDLETLTKRDQIYRLRKAREKARRSARVAAGVTLLLVVAIIATVIAWAQWQRVESARSALLGANIETAALLSQKVAADTAFLSLVNERILKSEELLEGVRSLRRQAELDGHGETYIESLNAKYDAAVKQSTEIRRRLESRLERIRAGIFTNFEIYVRLVKTTADASDPKVMELRLEDWQRESSHQEHQRNRADLFGRHIGEYRQTKTVPRERWMADLTE